MTHMINPLHGFNWHTLCTLYDALCKGFCPNAPHLKGIKPCPQTDRQLYYILVELIGSEIRSQSGIRLETYEALLYWKHYSNPLAGRNTYVKVGSHPNRTLLQQELTYMSTSLPVSLAKSRETVLD